MGCRISTASKANSLPKKQRDNLHVPISKIIQAEKSQEILENLSAHRESKVSTIISSDNKISNCSTESVNLPKLNVSLLPVKEPNSLDGILHEMAVRLKLPESVQRNVLKLLNDHGIYVIEPLKKATDSEWINIGLPLAVLKELKEKVHTIKEQDRLTRIKELKYCNLPSSLNETPPAVETSSFPTSAQKTVSEMLFTVTCVECGKILDKNEFDNHIQTCTPSKSRKLSSSFSKSVPPDTVPLATTISARPRSGNSKTRQRRPSSAASTVSVESLSKKESDTNSSPIANPGHDDSSSRRNSLYFEPVDSITQNRSRASSFGSSDYLRPDASISTTSVSTPSSARSRSSIHLELRQSFSFTDSDSERGDLSEDLDEAQLYIMEKTFQNGDKYVGQYKYNKQHGKGKYVFRNGDNYEGDFEYGYFSGIGTFKRSSGDIYTGHFRKDLFDGRGVYLYQDGEKYEGEYRKGDRHGHGKYFYKNGNTFEGKFQKGEISDGFYLFANGDRYEGLVLNDQFDGGKYTYASGDVYQGEYKGSMPNGFGTVTYSNGDAYEGEFDEGKRHGKGKYTYASGKIHEGTYVNGKRQGYGKYMDSEGVYDGNFSDGNMVGRGTFVFHNGDWYEGEFVNNTFEGFGVMVEKESKYEGSFVAGQRNGRGRWFLDNGDIYEGEFKKGVQDGIGSYTWLDGRRYIGSFKNGKPNGNGKLLLTNGDIIEGEFKDGNLANSSSHFLPETKNPLNNENSTPRGEKTMWKSVQQKVTPKTYNRVHKPFLAQYNNSSLF